MSIFGSHTQKKVAGVILDVGSGSVGVAIVEQTPDEVNPKILWSHREYILAKEHTDIRALLRDIHASLINVFLELGSRGMSEVGSFLTFSDVQVTLCAPWAHTATKTIQYEKKEKFIIHESFINELVKSSSSEGDAGDSMLKELGLKVISQTVAEITLNEYAVHDPIKKEVTAVSVSIITSAAQEKIIKTIEESCEKVVPGAEIHYHSFIDVLYRTLKHLKPHTPEICIVDVTDEATELGIVRDDVLRHCSFRPVGLYTLARSLSVSLSLSQEEVISIMGHSEEERQSMYSTTENEKINEMCASYEDSLVALFSDTGDMLAIPSSIFIHTDSKIEQFVTERIKGATQRDSKVKRNTYLVSAELFEQKVLEDSALCVGAYFFNNKKAILEEKET